MIVLAMYRLPSNSVVGISREAKGAYVPRVGNEVYAVFMNATLRLVPYDSEWPARFAAEATRLRDALVMAPLAIEHLGSTAVPGLAGKPVLDIGVAVASIHDADACIAPMQSLGYEYRGPYGDDPQRRYYVRSDDHGVRIAHVHMYVLPARAWDAMIAFRDALRADPALAAEYAAEKYRVADVVQWDKSAYSLAKGAFVQQILSRLERSGVLPPSA